MRRTHTFLIRSGLLVDMALPESALAEVPHKDQRKVARAAWLESIRKKSAKKR